VVSSQGAEPYSDEKVANRNGGLEFGGEIAHAAFRDARRFPSPRLYPVLSCTRMTRKFGICLSLAIFV
jgi:hypothetical protein